MQARPVKYNTVSNDIVGLLFTQWRTKYHYVIRDHKTQYCTVKSHAHEHAIVFIRYPDCKFREEIVLETVTDTAKSIRRNVLAAKNFRLVCKSAARVYSIKDIFTRIGGSLFRRQYCHLMQVNARLSYEYLIKCYAANMVKQYMRRGEFYYKTPVYSKYYCGYGTTNIVYNSSDVMDKLMENPLRILDNSIMCAYIRQHPMTYASSGTRYQRSGYYALFRATTIQPSQSWYPTFIPTYISPYNTELTMNTVNTYNTVPQLHANARPVTSSKPIKNVNTRPRKHETANGKKLARELNKKNPQPKEKVFNGLFRKQNRR